MAERLPISTSHCTVERDGPVVTVTMNRPEARNALSADMLVGMAEAWASRTASAPSAASPSTSNPGSRANMPLSPSLTTGDGRFACGGVPDLALARSGTPTAR